jgi:flagellar biogenesis protein FliO
MEWQRIERPGKVQAMKNPMESTQLEIVPTYPPNSMRLIALAASLLKAFWHAVMSHAGRKRKALSVRESAALGDRRFVSVIQFERQRFLIGSSPSSVTLLAQLPDQPASGEGIVEARGEKSGERN